MPVEVALKTQKQKVQIRLQLHQLLKLLSQIQFLQLLRIQFLLILQNKSIRLQ